MLKDPQNTYLNQQNHYAYRNKLNSSKQITKINSLVIPIIQLGKVFKKQLELHLMLLFLMDHINLIKLMASMVQDLKLDMIYKWLIQDFNSVKIKA